MCLKGHTIKKKKKKKRQTTERENVFESHVSGKGLVSRIKNRYNSTVRRQLYLKTGKYFCKDFQMANKYMQRHSTLVIQEMKIKTTMRYEFTLTEMVTIKKMDNDKH